MVKPMSPTVNGMIPRSRIYFPPLSTTIMYCSLAKAIEVNIAIVAIPTQIVSTPPKAMIAAYSRMHALVNVLMLFSLKEQMLFHHRR